MLKLCVRWSLKDYPSSWPEKSAAQFTHGSMLWVAQQEDLLANDSNIHAGLRTRLSGIDYADYDGDHALGFRHLEAAGKTLDRYDGIYNNA